MLDAPNLLMLDFDRELFIEDTLKEVSDRLRFMRVSFLTIAIEKSSSGRGYHFVITLSDEWPLVSRIAMQAICGSDLKREAINFHRACHVTSDEAGPYKNILFSQKDSVIVSTHGRNQTSSKSDTGQNG